MNRRVLPFIAAALVLGAAIGWWARGDAQPPPADSVPSVVSPAGTTSPTAPAAGPVQRRELAVPPGADSQRVQLASALEEERRMNEQLRSEIAALKDPPPRARLPFPAHAPPEAKDPAQFRRVAERALAECGSGYMLEAVDCTEYPCIGWARQKAPDPSSPRLNLNQCAPWKETFGDRTAQQMRGIKTDDGGVARHLAFFAFSERDDESTMRAMSDSAEERINGYFEPLRPRL